MADWLQSIANLTSGRVSDPSQDRMYANYPSMQPTTDIGVQGQVQAVPFGDITDPVSTLAGIAAPGLLRGIESLVQQGSRAPSLFKNPILGSQRGSTGAGGDVPLDESSMEALKRLFMERGGTDKSIGSVRATPEEFKASIPLEKQPTNVIAPSKAGDWSSANYNALLEKYPQYKDSIKSMADRYDSTNVNVALEDKPFRDMLDIISRNNGVIDNRHQDRMLGFLRHRLDKSIRSLDDAVDKGYLSYISSGDKTSYKVTTGTRNGLIAGWFKFLGLD